MERSRVKGKWSVCLMVCQFDAQETQRLEEPLLLVQSHPEKAPVCVGTSASSLFKNGESQSLLVVGSGESIRVNSQGVVTKPSLVSQKYHQDRDSFVLEEWGMKQLIFVFKWKERVI